MAERFGGKYSPGGSGRGPEPAPSTNRFRGARVAKSSFRSRLLFVLPLPLLVAGLGEMRAGDSLGMISEFGALILLLLSAWLVRDGLAAEAAYDARAVARPPAIPRKLFAAVACGLGVALAAWGGVGQPVVASILAGAIAGGAQLVSFGLDPMKKKGMEGMSEFDTQRVASAIDKAEKLLSETLTAARRIGDRTLEGRVERVAKAARDMFRAVEEDPRDLASARKFLTVYLMGARDATIKFADVYGKTRDETARVDYESLLGDLEASFTAQKVAMLADTKSDLDVEIEVLRDRLRATGLTAPTEETL